MQKLGEEKIIEKINFQKAGSKRKRQAAIAGNHKLE